MGLHNIPLSVELSQKEVNDFTKLYNDKIGNSEFDLLVYGRVENMIIKGNVLDIDTDINSYYICDTKMRKFPVFYDGVNTHILNYDERLIDDVGLYNKRIDFYDASKSKVKSILEKFM